MKKTILVFLILISLVSLAQERADITIAWTPKSEFNFGSLKTTIPQFNKENFEFNSYTRQVFFVLKIPLSSVTNENDLEITNIVYENCTTEDLGDLLLNAIPKNPNATIRISKARDLLLGLITLSPIIREGNNFKKIKSFSYNIKNGNSRIAQNFKTTATISNSVLASGDWYRFYVEKSGIYQLDASFLKQLGISTKDLDPRKIKIYGNGGRMLPLANNVDYPNDLAENAIQVSGGADGVFDPNDTVLFYAEGTDNWNEESQTNINLYDSKSYYYINTQGTNGKRITNWPQPTGTSTALINNFDDYQYHELDKVNIVKLGRRWFGEQFGITDEQEFNFNIPNIVPSSSINLTVFAAAASLTTTSFDIKANGQPVTSMPFSPIDNFSLATTNAIMNSIAGAEEVKINLKYNNNGVPDSRGYLDYIILKSKRILKGYGKQFRFQYDLSNATIGIGEFQITNATTIPQVWDITDIYNVSNAENTSNQATFSFKANLGEVRKYIALDPADFYTPLKENQSKVVNQDLKGTVFKDANGSFKDVDYLIICPEFLQNQAEKLAAFHRNNSQLNTKVISLEKIYQEFSSGKQDISAIRNFVKYVYANASPGNQVKYLNLFGDASYDFKNRISPNSNIVPIFHALNSYTLGESSFASDDFFGLMDDNEGNVENYKGNLDIAVGRMLANTSSQADELVNKVIDYYDPKSFGNWRNNFVVIADDADKPSDASLQFRLNKMADKVVEQKPFMNVKKILLDSYVQETSTGGNRYPKARQDVFDAFEKGALVFNYLGHGGEDGLAQERIWEKSDGQNLKNRYKYPLFITITCDFSRFDNPLRPTAGEYTYWNPTGGAISMITTIREIGQTTGENFNDTLASFLYSYGSNQYHSIAEDLRLSKNNFAPRTDVVFYLGDPALVLAIPKPKIILTKVNDMPISGPIEDFKSLGHIKLTGQLTDENNTLLPNYSGELSVQIFDKEINKATLNNDGNSPSIPFKTLGETIFRGNATISNGIFEFAFVVPRDIAIPVANGRISFYAKGNQILLDNTGFNTAIKIGGINESAAKDITPPIVKLYMNDQSFVNGGITNESPIFLALLQDENGINTASGIGHDIVAILDGNENNPYKLNDYYETELDNYKSGKLKFPFRNLTKGLHTISFKAWDVYNNLATSEIQFLVVGDDSITLTNVLNYPNPFVSYTQFWFTHNKPFEPLEVQIQVLTITGKIVWTRNQTVTDDGFLSRDISWDGKDDFGERIGKGVYIYKLTVKSVLTNTKSEKYEKLVIL